MSLDSQFAEGEAKSHSFPGGNFTGFEGKVLVENALVIGFGYSGAFIFNAHPDPALLPGITEIAVSRLDSRRPCRRILAIAQYFNGDGDMAALRAVLDGVIQQVDQRSVNPGLIESYHERSRRDLNVNGDAFFLAK